MIKKIIPLLSAALLLTVCFSHAQNEVDALRFSTVGITGTARSAGVGGAFSAVGADYSSSFLNPAGLALYRRSELEFTPNFGVIDQQSNYLDGEEHAAKGNFTFSNLGYVFAGARQRYNRDSRQMEDASGGLKSYSFSVGFNQTANYRRATEVSAFNTQNSITDYFDAQAEGNYYGDLSGLAGLAWDAFLIDTSGSPYTYIPAVANGNVKQTISRDERGRNNEWTLGLAGNISDRVYIGATMGIHNLTYQNQLEYLEEDIYNLHQTLNSDSLPFEYLVYSDAFNTRATGVNFRGGIIIRPFDFFRLGISFQSPTWLSMRDEYSSQIQGKLDPAAAPYESGITEGLFTYNFRTPYKVTAGLMYMIRKLGFLTLDFDYLDYSSTKYSSDVAPGTTGYYDFVTENQNIGLQFDAAYNIRGGAEYRLGPLRFRAGYANFGSVLREDYLQYVEYPSGEDKKIKGFQQSITGGFGFKQESFYIDLAIVRSISEGRQLFYSLPNAYSPELISKTTSNRFLLTIGFTY